MVKVEFKQITSAEGYEGRTRRFVVFEGTKRLSFGDWIEAMKKNSNSEAEKMTQLLRDMSYPAFRFETPAVSAESLPDVPFEFVVVSDRPLEKNGAKQDSEPFADYLECPMGMETINNNRGPAATKFRNKGKDATLVAPRDWDSAPTDSNYHGHIANFMRGATMEQAIQVGQLKLTV